MQPGNLVIDRLDGSGDLAPFARLLKRAVCRLTVQHQGLTQQVDQIGKRDQSLIGLPPVALEQIVEKGCFRDEIEHVQRGIGQGQAATNLGVKGHRPYSLGEKHGAQLRNNVFAKGLLVVKDLQSSRLET